MTLPAGTARPIGVGLLELLTQRVQYVVPDYQRPYCWDESQCETFFYEVLAASCASQQQTQFLGAMVWSRPPRGTERLHRRVLLDGQQRLVTCALLMAALREKLVRSAATSPSTKVELTILKRCLFNMDSLSPYGPRKLRLPAPQDDCLEKALAGHTDDMEPDNAVSRNFVLLRALVEAYDARFILAGLRKLFVILLQSKPDLMDIGFHPVFQPSTHDQNDAGISSGIGGEAEEIENRDQEGVMRILHSRVQHGVGQGSFHSASVEVESADGKRHRLDYVYDCGALIGSGPSQALLRSIDRIDLTRRSRGSGAKPVIDAVVLSHFDRDHIIGAKLLAQRFSIERIFAPYLSPEELMLVLASQAAGLAGSEIRSLHSLALGGGSLFEIPVTMILPGGFDGDLTPVTDDGNPQIPDGRDGPNDSPFPDAMTTTVGDGRQGLGPRLLSNDNVQLGFGHHQRQETIWKFRFWNRGVDDDLLAILFDELVMCGFPLMALQDASAVDELVDWLEVSANRKATLRAYQSAVARYKPAWASEASGKKLANFLSIAMYSGPDTPQRWLIEYSRLDAQDGYPGPTDRYSRYRDRYDDDWLHLDDRAGWLGTGDAPLGEPGVWLDFSNHYAVEIPLTRTVVIPHHGAAPRAGPKFNNPRLIDRRGVSAVISVGKANTYGHPTVAVMKEIHAANGNLQLVTEDTSLGFHEVFVLES